MVESSSKMRLKKSEARILLLCMIAMASADNKLHANETRVISSVFEKLIGTPLDEAFLREIFELSRYNRAAVLDEGSLTGFSPQLKRLIVKSCYLVKIADREITESELDMLATIAARLDVSETELSSVIREVTSD